MFGIVNLMPEQNQVQEKIDVLARFDKSGVTPLLFKYGERTIKIESIDLKYSSRSGTVDFYTFHASTKTASYKITYNSQSLVWILEEISAD